MTTVKEITHDSSTTLSDFYTTITDLDGALSVTPVAALGGSVNGVNVNFDAGTNVPILLEPFTAISGNEIRFRARVNIDNVTFSGSESVMNLFLRDSNGDTVFRVIMNANAGGTNALLTLFAITDIGTSVIGADTPMSAGDTCFEIQAIRETADGNADGIANFYVGNSLAGSATNLENFNNWAANGGMQELRITFAGTAIPTGNLYYDEFILNDSASVDLGCTPAKTLADMTKPADIDAAGAFIYVALLQDGFPILAKISTALNANGTIVFDPGDGDNIGVQCGRFNSDVIWVTGIFDGTNTVEKSEDAGSSFVVKDDTTFTSIFTFVVGPDTDDRVLINDNDTDIVETVDNGETWTKTNDGGNFAVNAIARLGKNIQETVFGNLATGSDAIDYSVNSGANLEDYQVGVYPNEDCTGVIVN